MSDYKFNPSTGEFENIQERGVSKKKGIGFWGLLFLLFPFLGFVLYFFMRNSKPYKAKSILNWSIVGMILFIIGMMNN